MTPREVKQSPQPVGLDETPVFTFDWTGIGTPSLPSVKMLDKTNSWADVSATMLQVAPSVNGLIVTCPAVKGDQLNIDHEYLLLNQCTVGGQKLSLFCIIHPEH